MLLALAGLGLVGSCEATPDLRFDVVTFCCDCTNTGSSMCQPQFDHLNFPTPNGHFLAMGSDSHRADLLANGNVLAIYYDTLNDGFMTNGGVTAAAVIDANSQSLFTTSGPRPNWIVLNEISSGLWSTNQAYRNWVRDVVHTLRTTYGYSVIVYSPFPNPANNATDWQAVAADAYIAVENYLSGQAVQSQNFSVSWCQGQYQSSITSYNAVGVAKSRLILGEHFAQTAANTGFGRSGVSSNNWDSAINARSQAALNLGFAGFIGYAWDKNGLGVTTNEMIHFEDTYASDALPGPEILTPPYFLLQPQNQTGPSGATVTFTGFPAGTTPVTYQWRFNGSNISGATTSSLVVTNIGPANAGNYLLVMSNSVGATLSSNAVLAVQVPPPLAFDPFVSASASNGTAYATNAPLIGQTNAQGITWFQAGPNAALTNQPLIQSGNLNVGNLASPTGNSVRFGGGGGMGARFPIATNTAGISSGTVYYSFALKLASITGLSSPGVFWAGFNNSSGAQMTTPNVVGTRIYTRAAGGGFNLGLSKASGTSTDWQWDTAVHTTNETIFIVGSYTVNANSSSDDSASLWINPAAPAFGTAFAPVPTLTANSGGDISSSVVQSFVVFNRDPTEPASGVMDELRIGNSWASVTPPATIVPTLNITISGANAILSWTTNATGFGLQTVSGLSGVNGWVAVELPVNIVGNLFTVTNALSASTQYFRLQKP